MFFGFCVSLLILKQKPNKNHQTNKQEKKARFCILVFLVWKWPNTRTQTNTQKGRKTKNGEECKAEKQSKKKKRNFFFSFFLAERCIENKIPFSKTVVEFVPIVQAARHFHFSFFL
jgi:predicted ATP-dependent protease